MSQTPIDPAEALKEAQPEPSMADLFQTDPEKLTRRSLDRMVAFFQSERARFAQEEAKAKAEGKKTPRQKKLDLDATLGDLDLEDL